MQVPGFFGTYFSAVLASSFLAAPSSFLASPAAASSFLASPAAASSFLAAPSSFLASFECPHLRPSAHPLSATSESHFSFSLARTTVLAAAASSFLAASSWAITTAANRRANFI